MRQDNEQSCLACGGPIERPLARAYSLRCHDCRATNAPLQQALVDAHTRAARAPVTRRIRLAYLACAIAALALLAVYASSTFLPGEKKVRPPYTGCDPLSRTVNGVRYIRKADLDGGTYPIGRLPNGSGFVPINRCP